MLSTKEMCVNEIIERLNKSQPAISHHLKIQKQAGLVLQSREGKWFNYCINEKVFENVFQDADDEVIKSYAEPIKRMLAGGFKIKDNNCL